MNPTKLCLNEIDLNDYLNGSLSQERRAEVEKHLAACDKCLEKTVFAYEAVRDFEQKPKGETRMESRSVRWKRNLWLVLAILSFTLSFFVPRYFVQLLVATILTGMKWIFDSVNARILIMIYDAWKTGGEHEAAKVLRTLSSSNNSNRPRH